MVQNDRRREMREFDSRIYFSSLLQSHLRDNLFICIRLLNRTKASPLRASPLASANEASCYEIFVASDGQGSEIAFTIRICMTKRCALFQQGKGDDAHSLLAEQATAIARDLIDSGANPQDGMIEFCVTEESYPKAVSTHST